MTKVQMPKWCSINARKLDFLVFRTFRNLTGHCEMCGKRLNPKDSFSFHHWYIPKNMCTRKLLPLRYYNANLMLLCAGCHLMRLHTRSIGMVIYPMYDRFYNEHKDDIIRMRTFFCKNAGAKNKNQVELNLQLLEEAFEAIKREDYAFFDFRDLVV